MHFHQWELKCTSAVFTRFKPSTSVFFQLHCCTIVQPQDGNLNLLLIFQPTTVQLCNLNCRALLISVKRHTEGRDLGYAVVRLYDSATERKQMYFALEQPIIHLKTSASVLLSLDAKWSHNFLFFFLWFIQFTRTKTCPFFYSFCLFPMIFDTLLHKVWKAFLYNFLNRLVILAQKSPITLSYFHASLKVIYRLQFVFHTILFL